MISRVIGNRWRELELLAERLTPLRTYWRYGHSEREEVVVLACTSMCLTAEMYREIDLGANFCCDRKAANRQRLFCVRGSGLRPALLQNSM